ncbi:MAG: response regulator [Deltaproteobacteria bacterium]|nr:MAG: response regulator [Deltaproteobacteria bacterium]
MTESELDFDSEELAMLRQLFRSEAHDALEAVTARVLASGSSPPSPDALTEMMRATHTLKGAAGTVGLPAMVDLSHRLEDVLALFARDRSLWVTGTADVLVEVVDALRSYLDMMDDAGAEAAADELRTTLDQLARTIRAAKQRTSIARREPTGKAPGAARASAPTPELRELPELREQPQPSLPQPSAPTDAGSTAVPEATRPAAELTRAEAEAAQAEMPRADAIDGGTGAGTMPGADGAAPAEPKAWLRVEPERVDAVMSSAGELLFDRTRIERRVQLLRTLARDLARTRQSLHDAIADDAAAPPPLRNALLDAEGELAGQAALLSQTTAALLDEIEALRRTIGELQRGLTRIRMESARSLMLHAARTLRALRRATGQRVELRTFGEATEFDKTVAERLIDPVTQLLRNAVAHGIEPPEERAARGKPAVATVTIRARQDGNSLVLEVSDDGRGIDTAVLSRRLVATGRWSPARARLANDADVLDALLNTGISTRGEADELAGRGVGIGLVRETVARLGGEVKVASVPGKGTTFTLRLPLSAALTQAMLFKVDGQVYAVSSLHVVDTTHVEAYATTATVRDDVLPVVRLEQLLGHGAATDRRPAIVVAFAGKSLVCTVDKVIGAREIVIKPLGPLLAPLTLYAGATISGSGKVQLILDPAQLVRRAYPDVPVTLIDPGAARMTLAGRALVVDDSRAIREAMTSMLGSEGWIVDVAEDGARALHMARQLHYDLVVTDLEMPELGGFELIARLRQDARLKTAPIVVITSRANADNRRRARDLGVRALVAKPITRRKLLEALAAR